MVKGIGILALQGDFEAHQRKLSELGVAPLLVKKPEQLAALSGLILPGGESTTMLRLLNADFQIAIKQAVDRKMTVLATCAGCILLAQHVSNPEQESLQLLDIDVTRNAYGRQVDSFITTALAWTTRGQDICRQVLRENSGEINQEGVFIRAPQIVRTGPGVEVLITERGLPVLVKQQNILAATFHPELSVTGSVVHRLLLALSRAVC